jgi:hypothetical protein
MITCQNQQKDAAPNGLKKHTESPNIYILLVLSAEASLQKFFANGQ